MLNQNRGKCRCLSMCWCVRKCVVKCLWCYLRWLRWGWLRRSCANALRRPAIRRGQKPRRALRGPPFRIYDERCDVHSVLDLVVAPGHAHVEALQHEHLVLLVLDRHVSAHPAFIRQVGGILLLLAITNKCIVTEIRDLLAAADATNIS